jgi:hypothetical protein
VCPANNVVGMRSATRLLAIGMGRLKVQEGEKMVLCDRIGGGLFAGLRSPREGRGLHEGQGYQKYPRLRRTFPPLTAPELLDQLGHCDLIQIQGPECLDIRKHEFVKLRYI